MTDILIHIHTGPDDPTKATLGLLVAAAAVKAGHDTAIFLAGDAVRRLDPKVIARLEGIGTGKLKEHLALLDADNCKFFVSGMSARSRGFDDTILSGRRALFAQPDKLVELATSAGTLLCY